MGLTHVDAGVVIGLLDSSDAHHAVASEFLRTVSRSGDNLAIAASAFAECLVGPSRVGERAVKVVESLCASLPIDVVPLDRETARRAARLRATHASLRLPDALVIAAADVGSADRIVTTDRRWPSRHALGVACDIVHL